MIDSTFRTMPDQAHRAMAGLSMGGMQTNAIAMEHLDVFGVDRHLQRRHGRRSRDGAQRGHG